MNLNEYIEKLNNNIDFSIFENNHGYLNFGNKTALRNQFKRNFEFSNILNKLLNIAINIFKWDFGELPFSKRIIELGFIMSNGVCCFIDNGIFILPARPTRELNLYGEPKSVIVTGYNYTKEIKIINVDTEIVENGIGIYARDSDTNYCLYNYILAYAEKISDKMRALDILTQKLKSPYIVKCAKEEEATIKKALSKLFENDDLILLTDDIKNLDNTTELLTTNINPDLIKAMKESILFDYNNFLEIIGINTDPNPDKAERKLVDEVNSNNDLIKLQLESRLEKRKRFCKKVKKVFNIDINVELSIGGSDEQMGVEQLLNRFGKENQDEKDGDETS